jgi:N-acyl-D-aspartate/D-glutamate deacylase
MYDVLIKNGTVFDGSGQESFHSSLAVKNGKIVKIGNDIKDKEAKLVIDAKDKNVTPGFIDLNTNISNPKDSNLVKKGITTAISGFYGSSSAPIVRNISNANIS